MKIIVLDKATLGDDISLDRFGEFGEVVIYQTSTQEEVLERICDADVVVVNKIKINENVLSYAKNLKLVCVAATGYDNIDVAACKARNVAVCNVVGYSTHSVAQVTLAMVLSLSVKLKNFTEFVESGEYTKSGVANKLTPVYHELCGKVWGVVGYGNIAKQVIKVAEAMGCKVIVNRRTPCGEEGFVDLKTLCKESDIISVHTPLNDSTRGMINEEILSVMKKDVIIVNTARGAVTDEEAIAKAIKDKRIGAFGCDVYSVEPFSKTHPFNEIMGYNNVCLTPHMAWGSFESRNRCMDEIAKNIRAFFAGEKRNRVDI